MSTYIFRSNSDIGALDAENDRFLMHAFVTKNETEILRDVDNPRCILMGRTGIGKSAFLIHLEKTEKNVVRIDPESLSLRHLSNSNIINYFQALDIKLDLFYKVLWKHVFIVELIKLHSEGVRSKTDGLLTWLKEQLPDKKKQKAISYLENWEDKFWEKTEYQIKEMETSLEDRFTKAIGGKVNLSSYFSADGNLEKVKNISKTEKYEIIQKAKSVINESQIEDIKEIYDIMKDHLFRGKQRKYFIVIDDLDRDWVDTKIVYDLLRALIDVIKDFSNIPNVKISTAFRTNLIKKLYHANEKRGVQREKYNHLFIDVDWSEDELKELLNKRIAELMKGTYTNEVPTIKQVLPPQKNKIPSGFDYIVERSLKRPRDIINFFNKCIKYSNGDTRITMEAIKKAEDEYSHERLQAVNDEWLENYGNLSCLYGFLKGIKNGFEIHEIKSETENYFVDSISAGDLKGLKGECRNWVEQFGEDFSYEGFIQKTLVLLYEIGIIGIKKSSTTKVEFAHESYSLVQKQELIPTSKFYIHPMYQKAFRTRKGN